MSYNKVSLTIYQRQRASMMVGLIFFWLKKMNYMKMRKTKCPENNDLIE